MVVVTKKFDPLLKKFRYAAKGLDRKARGFILTRV